MRRWLVLLLLAVILLATFKVSLPVRAGTLEQNVHSEKIDWKQKKPKPVLVEGEYALGVPSLGGVFMKSSNQASAPIASLTKMMTAVLVIEAHPLGKNQSGPSIHFNQRDVQILHSDIANGDSVVQIKNGETMTERQALEALLIPSGDNIATKLAQWVSGSVPKFVAKMNSTAESWGMIHTHYADTSGVDPKTISDAQDQWLMAAKFMTFPVLREIVSQKSASVPVAGTVYNYNMLLGTDGIVGIKTGNTSQAGGNLAAAQRLSQNHKSILLISVILGQRSSPPLAKVFKVTPKLLHIAKANLISKTLVRKGQRVGNITFPWGQRIVLVAEQSLTISVVPGEHISQTLKLETDYRHLHQGVTAGQLTVKTPNNSYLVKVMPESTYKDPGLLWRILH
ncbi:D-alanyl-D-alanine carboxypeptidase family protein [Alicyclobacillus sp. SO9]|uniref:D-alanyl-D-alanine carboxypeptidase family protein n=1 Tax=Alicyclobacillus sp. SO9 TaxID=2665646 RepID=UPI0018E6F0A3|nr:D-alanyl-D-alanine carboxypeptidase [Alicyclobacillus sp. SO9]QQE77183.1 D-alanyl-D-alanine carboxypeptidase [Alicyclobacillus sp. SO9]